MKQMDRSLARWVGLIALSLLPLVCSDAAEDQFLTGARQLTFDGKRSGEAYFSPDGRSLLFQSEREEGNPFYQIYMLDLQTGESHRVSPGIGKTTCAFFRPGTDELLFASTHLDPEAETKQQQEIEFRASGKERRYSWDYDPHYDIFVSKRDGTGLRQITDAFGYDAEAAFSPDGKQIVFTSLRHVYGKQTLTAEEQKQLEVDPSFFGDIYMMNADGTGVRRLTERPGYDGGPFFSPDGERILWRHFRESGIADVFSMKTDGSDVRQLTDFSCMSWAPFPHPSGDYFIFTANKLGFGNFELYFADALGSREPIRVTHTDGFDGLPVFSPDGKQLCWTSTRGSGGTSQLFLAGWNHAAAKEALQRAPDRNANPTPTEPEPETGEGATPLHAGTNDNLSVAITASDLERHVRYLASDELHGRLTGSEGTRKAAEYIIEQLRMARLKPGAAEDSFLQEFDFNAGVQTVTNENYLVVHQTAPATQQIRFAVEQDFRPLSFTANDSVSGPVVFAGYGLAVPGEGAKRYNSYDGLDVTNKIVMVLRYVPEQVSSSRRQELNRYAGLRYKATIARNHGAKAILIVTGPNSPNPGALAPLTFDTSLAGSGIVAASVSLDVANALLAPSGKSLQELQSALDSENPHAESGFVLPGVTAEIRTAVKRIHAQDSNVVGLLPGVGPATNEYVLLGAHYDHLGLGERDSRTSTGDGSEIHNGADDNASGVALLLELAAALADQKAARPELFQRNVLFAFWSGEELGLIGSSHFAEHPPMPLSNIVAYLNFDMVGRLRENQLILQGTASSPVWRRLIEKRNVTAGFDLSLQEDPYLPTDVSALYPKEVPVLNFFTGSHDDYHRASDDPATLNYEGLERISKFAHGLTLDLLSAEERPEYVKVQQTHSTGTRDNLRAYLGTIPDYTTELQGVKLSGVRGGSPAEKGGLKAGDIIVQFAGNKITNIYDYTYALDAARLGQPVEIIILREGKRMPITVIPEPRP